MKWVRIIWDEPVDFIIYNFWRSTRLLELVSGIFVDESSAEANLIAREKADINELLQEVMPSQAQNQSVLIITSFR